MKSKIISVAFCVALLSACGQGENGASKAPEAAVMTVETATANLTNSYPANISGKQDVEIRPMVSGFITKLHVDEGAKVHKGQVLFTIDQVPYQAALRTAKASVETAKAALATQKLTTTNKRELNKRGVISDYDLQTAENALAQAEATLAQAEAQLVTAEQNLSYTEVKAPTDGVIGLINYRLGALVSSSIAEPLTVVSETSEMYADFSMPEREVVKMVKSAGSQEEALASLPKVQLQLIDGTMYPDSGRVMTFTGTVSADTKSVRVRALFPNKNYFLRSGYTVNVVFPNVLTDIIVIPQTATTEIQDKKFVFVVQDDNTLKTTEVKVYYLNDGKNYYVTSGLKSGDRIVVEGVQALQDGQAITPTTVADKEAKYQQALKDQSEGNIESALKK